MVLSRFSKEKSSLFWLPKTNILNWMFGSTTDHREYICYFMFPPIPVWIWLKLSDGKMEFSLCKILLTKRPKTMFIICSRLGWKLDLFCSFSTFICWLTDLGYAVGLSICFVMYWYKSVQSCSYLTFTDTLVNVDRSSDTKTD